MRNKVIIWMMCIISSFGILCAQTSHTHQKQDQKQKVVSEILIKNGSGSFYMSGGQGHEEDVIEVHYYKPENFNKQSKILIVVPGAGRNGDSYRDSWIEASEKHNVLILSPAYYEDVYKFEDYHLGGLLSNSNIKDCVIFKENSNVVELNEEKFEFTVDLQPGNWIFNDFDRLFENVVKAMNSSQSKYDIFGHSAGGQILHRFVLFLPNTKADRILASNSGFYTVPDFTFPLPFGIKNTYLTEEILKNSLKKRLVLFIGELDNENETGGHLLRSPTVDKQGLHRLERANYFFNTGKDVASKMHTMFNWELEIVPNIGHNQRKMAKEAAKYLYEN